MIRSQLRLELLRMAERPAGVGTDEVDGMTVKQVGRAIEGLMRAGLVFPARSVVFGSRHKRYFCSPPAAAAFHLANVPMRSAGYALQPGFVATWGPDEPTVYPPGYKHTVYPPSRIGEFITNTHRSDW